MSPLTQVEPILAASMLKSSSQNSDRHDADDPVWRWYEPGQMPGVCACVRVWVSVGMCACVRVRVHVCVRADK